MGLLASGGCTDLQLPHSTARTAAASQDEILTSLLRTDTDTVGQMWLGHVSHHSMATYCRDLGSCPDRPWSGCNSSVMDKGNYSPVGGPLLLQRSLFDAVQSNACQFSRRYAPSVTKAKTSMFRRRDMICLLARMQTYLQNHARVHSRSRPSSLSRESACEFRDAGEGKMQMLSSSSL